MKERIKGSELNLKIAMKENEYYRNQMEYGKYLNNKQAVKIMVSTISTNTEYAINI